MKVKELRGRTEADLLAELAKTRHEAHEGRVKLRLNQMKNVKAVSVLKRDIARILTILAEMKASK
ncbi:MAG: 50S ribosomal protein L29 [Candidatus Doudnabacteria bacterium]|nr:50S ribosomal protein L29 [Candidatus Doudnabacteria bacterium]